MSGKAIPKLYEVSLHPAVEAFIKNFSSTTNGDGVVYSIPVVFYRAETYKKGVYSVLSENPWPILEPFLTSDTVKSYGFTYVRTSKNGGHIVYKLKQDDMICYYDLHIYPKMEEIAIYRITEVPGSKVEADIESIYSGKCSDSFFKLLLPNLIQNIQRK